MDGRKKPKTIKEFSVFQEEEGKQVEKTYLLVEPTAKVIRDARWQYSIAYSNALRDGLLTERQMSRILEKQQSDDDSQSAKLAALYIQAVSLEDKMSKSEDIRKKQKLAEDLRVIREQVVREEQEIRAPYYNTAEQKAEEVRGDYMMRFMVRSNDTDPICLWPTEEDYEQEVDSVLVETARTNFLYWLYNLDDKWEQNLPENRVFSEDLVKAEEEAEGKVEEEEKQNKKPKKKKKTTKKRPAKKSSKVE